MRAYGQLSTVNCRLMTFDSQRGGRRAAQPCAPVQPGSDRRSDGDSWSRWRQPQHHRATPPPPPQYNNVPLPPPAGSQSDIPPPRQGILGRVDIDQEDIDEVAEKAKKGLGAAWRLARKGLSKGAELASQGIEVAKDTIEERREQQQANQAPPSAPAPEGTRFCPSCGQPAPPGKFCNNCGHKLE